jgi:hypothetical protein
MYHGSLWKSESQTKKNYTHFARGHSNRMCGISPFSGTTINDDSMILFYLCLLLFSVLFRVSFTKLLFPVLLDLY